MALTPKQAYEAHVQQLADGDIDAVIDGYTPDAVMFANGDVYRGREAMRPIFERSRGNSILDLDLTTDVTIDGEVVYVRWRARTDGKPDLAGCDTFVFDDEGAIVVHSGFYTQAV